MIEKSEKASAILEVIKLKYLNNARQAKQIKTDNASIAFFRFLFLVLSTHIAVPYVIAVVANNNTTYFGPALI